MNYIIEHIDELLFIITGIVTVASAISALTPNPKDDTICMKLKKVIDVLALNVKNAKHDK